jgi:DNA-binding transcriptional MerR regulator
MLAAGRDQVTGSDLDLLGGLEVRLGSATFFSIRISRRMPSTAPRFAVVQEPGSGLFRMPDGGGCCDFASQVDAQGMQVKDVAELPGTTVRTIRYYHQIGLLVLPPVRSGRRDYDLSHVARLGRIRWLVDSGLPLAQITSALAITGEPGSTDQRDVVVTDLRETLDLLGERIQALTVQRDRLVILVATLEGGDSLSPMPRPVAAFYDALVEAAPDEVTLTGVRRERDFLELAYLRGEVPPEAELLFAAVDEQTRSASLAAFRDGLTSALREEDVDRIASANVERMRDRLGERLPQVAAAIDVEALHRLCELFLATGDDRDRRLGKAVLAKLVAMIAEARAHVGS